MNQAVGLVCVASIPSVAFASLDLVNGGFEPDSAIPNYVALPGGSSDIPGWTTTDSGVEWFDASVFGGASPDGGFAVDVANFTFSAGGIQQTVTLTPNTTYTIEFYLGTSSASGRTGTADVIVEASGFSGSESTTISIEGFGQANVWTYHEFEFVASDSETTISFRNLQDANRHFALVDGVRVVPSPGGVSFALIGLGVGGIRRRRPADQ